METCFPLVTFLSIIFTSYLLVGKYVEAADTLTPTQYLRDSQSLISANGVFELGFFNPSNSINRYLAVWYQKSMDRRPLWIANRETPLTDTSGTLTISDNGNLILTDGRNGTIWQSSTSSGSSYREAVMLDTGNFVLRTGVSNQSLKVVIWESFDYPTDTLIPGMKIGMDLTTQKPRALVSWRDVNDPSPGIFSFGIDPQRLNQFFIWRNSVPFWRSFFWSGNTARIEKGFLDFNMERNPDGVYITNFFSSSSTPETAFPKQGTTLVLTPFGEILFIEEKYNESRLLSIWSRKEQMCGLANGCFSIDDCNRDVCGAYSSCNDDTSPICRCLPGFQPRSSNEWNSGKWDAGCVANSPLGCKGDDGFLQLKRMRLQNDPIFMSSNETCQRSCLKDCACVAYAIGMNTEVDCGLFYGELKGLEEMEEQGTFHKQSGTWEAVDLNVRVASSELVNIVGGNRCPNCGNNIVPYPLSTGPSCGDPAYNGFSCNTTTGQLSFLASGGSSFPVKNIDAETQTFVIQPGHICWPTEGPSKELRLNSSRPFSLSRRNSVLLLNCSDPKKLSALKCSSSVICNRYMAEDGTASPCFASQNCCSYNTGGSSLTSYLIGLSGQECSAYTSFVNVNLSQSVESWLEGVEIGWKPSLEPICNSPIDCVTWPNSGCRKGAASDGRKRCLCNTSFQWDPVKLKCTQDGNQTKAKLALIVTLSIGVPVVLLAICLYCFWRRMVKKRQRRVSLRETNMQDIFDTNMIDGETEDFEVKFYTFESIIAATDNFSSSNKLGQGGFGLVYKGKLHDGQEMAVKRLSKSSGQGLEEFKNEVVLIGKLQHRNLVRLLGYCIQNDEKLLLYEYMPNKSLDSFIFDQNRSRLLDWEKRFLIILGVSRGLLYLHHDSRLRIIHRDLKTSNILLDADMNPKISDFGLARIFGGNQTQENTNRVVGTYGYISPEYASRGLFSTKSDVFSFGVIILEIVSGKKNSSFHHLEHSLTLLGHAWELWKENRALELVDPIFGESCNSSEVVKCIQVALLCVQEDAYDRPSMASVIAAFINESASLPRPKKPAFSLQTIMHDSSSGQLDSSKNEVTVSLIEGR